MKGNGRAYKSGTGLAFNIPMDTIRKLKIKPGNRLDVDILNPDPTYLHPKRKKEEPEESN